MAAQIAALGERLTTLQATSQAEQARFQSERARQLEHIRREIEATLVAQQTAVQLELTALTNAIALLAARVSLSEQGTHR